MKNLSDPNQMNMVERWNANTPKFFKKVIAAGITIGAIGGAILASPVVLPAAVVTAAGYAVTVGSVAAIVAKFAVDK